MIIQIGDLVECRVRRRVGVVVKKRPSVGGLDSAHVNHIIDSYPQVYYVFFPDEQVCDGPYYSDDLYVKQRRHSEQQVNIS
jgi:hypothetical protein